MKTLSALFLTVLVPSTPAPGQCGLGNDGFELTFLWQLGIN